VTKPLSGPMLPPRSGQAPKQLMVLLHGYGSDGADLISLGSYWGDTMPEMLFVSPNAPDACDINPAGYQWFPLQTDRTIGRVEGAGAGREIIVNFLIDLWGQTGLKPQDTFLVGFSQGAMMALHVGLSLDEPVAGIVSFSGALVPPAGLEEDKFPKPAVALIHGDLDSVVDPRLTEEASITLQRLGYDVSYHRSPTTAHGISPDMLEFATGFILARLADASD
jgi:phospholipase/carboxylesterase